MRGYLGAQDGARSKGAGWIDRRGMEGGKIAAILPPRKAILPASWAILPPGFLWSVVALLPIIWTESMWGPVRGQRWNSPSFLSSNRWSIRIRYWRMHEYIYCHRTKWAMTAVLVGVVFPKPEPIDHLFFFKPFGRRLKKEKYQEVAWSVNVAGARGMKLDFLGNSIL